MLNLLHNISRGIIRFSTFLLCDYNIVLYGLIAIHWDRLYDSDSRQWPTSPNMFNRMTNIPDWRQIKARPSRQYVHSVKYYYTCDSGWTVAWLQWLGTSRWGQKCPSLNVAITALYMSFQGMSPIPREHKICQLRISVLGNFMSILCFTQYQ